MRILIDLQACQSESRFRGIGRYSIALAEAIARHAGQHEISILLNDRFPNSVCRLKKQFENIVPPSHFYVCSIPAGVAEADRSSLWLTRASELVREFFIQNIKPDILHISSLFEGWADDSVTSIGQLSTMIPSSVTLYDLIPLLNKSVYLPNERLKVHYHSKIESLKKSNLLLSISNSSRQEAIQHLGFSREKIVNISAAVDPTIFHPQNLSKADRESILEKYSIREPFILYVPGGFDERKNIERLIQSYAKLGSDFTEKYSLVIAGKLPIAMDSRVSSIVSQQLLSPDRVVLTDYVEDFELTCLYSFCTLFIFPSIHEGFGLPVLEAMACGAPVVGSNISSIPEIILFPDAMFDPYSVDSISHLLKTGLSNQDFLERLKQNSQVQAAKFSWDKSAKIALHAFETVRSRRIIEDSRNPSTSIDSNNHLYQSLISKIKQLTEPKNLQKYKPDDLDLAKLAYCISTNLAAKEKKLLIDISELVQRDAKSGIQRVVRSILLELLRNPPSGYTPVPVYWDSICYRKANRFLKKLSTSNVFISEIWNTDGKNNSSNDDTIVDISYRDIFLGLDLTAHLAADTQSTFEALRDRGVDIYFIVYDILLLQHPEWWPQGLSKIFQRWLEMVSEVATGLICISQATADDVRDWLTPYPLKEGNRPKVSAFHLGADISQSLPSQGMPDKADQILSHMRSMPTFLMVGTVEPRKGYSQVLDAFELLWDSNKDINLVIVGKNGWNVDTLVKRLNSHRQLNKKLFWLQGISDEFLETVYEYSTVLLAASEGEGFGLPLIEAAQHKLPIIARNIPVFVEVAGENAFYFDAEYPQQLANAIDRWLDLYVSNQIPSSEAMQWLTWAESTEQLLHHVLP